MMNLNFPLGNEEAAALTAGQRVTVTGVILGARDAAHRLMAQSLEKGEGLPFDPAGQLIYYVGPSPLRPGNIIGSAGPTTAMRMDSFTPQLLSRGVKATMGKGRRGPEVVEACRRHKAVYLGTVGGAAAYLAQFITGARVAAFPELGTEALWEITVKDFPAVVMIDAEGNIFP